MQKSTVWQKLEDTIRFGARDTNTRSAQHRPVPLHTYAPLGLNENIKPAATIYFRRRMRRRLFR